MAMIRNMETQAAKDFWQKVDQAADRAPAWVKERIDRTSSPEPTRTSDPTPSSKTEVGELPNGKAR